jgi:hypothetical protein
MQGKRWWRMVVNVGRQSQKLPSIVPANQDKSAFCEGMGIVKNALYLVVTAESLGERFCIGVNHTQHRVQLPSRVKSARKDAKGAKIFLCVPSASLKTGFCAFA